MTDADPKVVCGNCEFPLQERPEHEWAPCPKCGSTTRKFFKEIAGELTPSGQLTASLIRFVDNSTPETAEASATALTCIALWVDDTEPLTVHHVIDGNLTAAKAGVPVGPFDDDRARKIVKTIFKDAEGRRAKRWDRTKTVVAWLLSLGGLAAAVLAYLKYFASNLFGGTP